MNNPFKGVSISIELTILALMAVLLTVRLFIYMINFWPGFGSFKWSRKTQKESYIKMVQTEIRKSESKPKLYQSMKYMDVALLVIYAVILFLSYNKYATFSTIPVKNGVVNLLVGSLLLNYT
jgi:Na+/H+ antiporter NhaC|tara:strand:+ start:777 stop:1142 length:366 start_codon:yes stop_codon:yes gene_type:complete